MQQDFSGKADTFMEKSRTLKTLLDKLEYEPVQGTLEREITAVVYDSRKVIPG